MKEQGTVIEVKVDSVVIESAPKEVCTKCCSCGASRPRQITISGEKAKGLKVGDTVEIDIASGMMMRLYTLFYGIPLAVFVVSILAIYAVCRVPIASFLGAVICTVITYVCVGYHIRKNPRFYPNICLKRSQEQ